MPRLTPYNLTIVINSSKASAKERKEIDEEIGQPCPYWTSHSMANIRFRESSLSYFDDRSCSEKMC